MNNEAKINKNSNKRLAIILLEALLLLGFIVVLFFSYKQVTNKTTKEKQATKSSSNQNQYISNSSVTGKVVAIDTKNRIVNLETLDGKKLQYKVKIPENIEMSRPSPIKEGDDPKTTSYPPIVEKFESLHVGSVLSIVGKDGLLANELTAIQVTVLV